MPVYKSISEFRHSAVISGKKYLINPGDVINSPTPLSYIFLQQVSDDTPVTVKSPFQNRLQQQVAAIQQEKEAIVTSSSSELEQLKQAFSQFTDKYESEMADILSQINSRFTENEQADLANKQADAKFREDTNRRLGILKDAVRSIEEEVYGPVEQPAKN
jgi:hypothetical protein